MKTIAFLICICCVLGCKSLEPVELTKLSAINSRQIIGEYWQLIDKKSISKLSIKPNMLFEIVTQANPYSFSRGHYTIDGVTLTMVTDSFCKPNLDLKTGEKNKGFVKIDLVNDTTMVKNSLKLKQNWMKSTQNTVFCVKNTTLYSINKFSATDRNIAFIEEDVAFFSVINGIINHSMVVWCLPK
jgi:hypothetical protein